MTAPRFTPTKSVVRFGRWMVWDSKLGRTLAHRGYPVYFPDRLAAQRRADELNAKPEDENA